MHKQRKIRLQLSPKCSVQQGIEESGEAAGGLQVRVSADAR
jgi:hypothetical protein